VFLTKWVVLVCHVELKQENANAPLGVALKGRLLVSYDDCLRFMYSQLAYLDSKFTLCYGEIKEWKSINVVHILFYMYSSLQ
jgi:hypothetical protein